MSEYSSIEQSEPGFVEDHPPERSPSTLPGISFRRRGIEYSPDGSFQENHSMLRTDSSLDSSYLDESSVSTPHKIIPTPHSVSFKQTFSREFESNSPTERAITPVNNPEVTPTPRRRLDAWSESQSDSMNSIKSFSEDDHEYSSGNGYSDHNLHLQSFQSRDSFEKRQSHVKVTTKAETVVNRSKTLSVNDYTFLKTIGKGAYAEVKLATKTPTDSNSLLPEEKYAIKIIKKNSFRDRTRSMKFKSRGTITSPPSTSISSSSVSNNNNNNTPPTIATVVAVPEEVLQEINIMKFLQHPNLITLNEIIDDCNSHYLYLVMEYMEAGPIMTFNQSTQLFVSRLTNDVLYESMARRAFSELLSALAYLHKNFIAHRDLKPDNLLVDFNGTLKVTDFGVSSHFTEEKRKTAINLKQLARSKSRGIVSKTEGTFPFYSPEMCQESGAGYSAYMSDLWAAGVCLWIFIFGKLPFFNADVVQLFSMIRNEEPIRPHRISPELDDLLTSLMRKDHKKRLSVFHLQNHCWVLGQPIKPPKRLTPPNIDPKTIGSDISLATYSTIPDSNSEGVVSNRPSIGDSEILFSNNIRLKIFRWKESAKATCNARKEKFIRNSNSDFSTLFRKSQMALKAQNSDSSAEEADEFNFSDHDGDSASSHDSDPLGRVVSYDTISHEILEEIKKAESKPARKSILSFLEQDDEKPPPVVRTPPISSTKSNVSPSTPYSNLTSSTISTPISTAPSNVVVLPPELIKKEKKALRTGRKKVNITTNGEVIPIVPTDNSPTNVTHKTNKTASTGASTVETLDQIMMELEKKEAEAKLRQKTNSSEKIKSVPQSSQEGCKRFFCCFQSQKVTN